MKTLRLEVCRTLDVPLREVSGICLHRGPDAKTSLIAVGDRAATLAMAAVQNRDGEALEWRTVDLSQFGGSSLPTDDPQIEAVCADGHGRVLLLQEQPPRAEFLDLSTYRVLATIRLDVRKDEKLARSWSDPESSHGEGMVLLPGGHLLVAKEKDPARLIEFGPAGHVSCGWAAQAPAATHWPVEPGDHHFVDLAVWKPEDALREVCEDFSDLEIGPDGRLYVLSDQSRSLARLDDLPSGGGTARLSGAWRLDLDKDDKPEGLAFDAQGRAIVALDHRKRRNNLVLFTPAIAGT